MTDAQDAERLGFGRAYVSERYSNKEAGVLLGAIGASTSRIGIGTIPVSLLARPPLVLAAMGSTMWSAFGSRFTLGVGRSDNDWLGGHGFGQATFEMTLDYVDIIKRLWRGEKVTYDGPAGSMSVKIDDLPDGTPPNVVFCGMLGPKSCRMAANPLLDGYAIGEGFTPGAVHRAVSVIRQECERIGRDPATLRIIAAVVTAPDADEFETLKQIGSRLVIMLQMPFYGELYASHNQWDMGILRRSGAIQGSRICTSITR